MFENRNEFSFTFTCRASVAGKKTLKIVISDEREKRPYRATAKYEHQTERTNERNEHTVLRLSYYMCVSRSPPPLQHIIHFLLCDYFDEVSLLSPESAFRNIKATR